MNKLASTAFTVATVEKMVLSGVPFWDDPNDVDLPEVGGSDDETEDAEASADRPSNAGSTARHRRAADLAEEFDPNGHRPLENVLANRVAERMAQERREKSQLLQDLENVHERFSEYGAVMRQQEMTTNLGRAAQFLGEAHQISYLGMLYTLHQMQEHYFQEGQGQKEIHFINEVIQKLTQHRDIKVTYSNGFHVNRAVTAIDRVDLEASCHSPEYASFFQATLPIIDEVALNPPEFNLVRGIYFDKLGGPTGTGRRPCYLGAPAVCAGGDRGYACLDYALTNLSTASRKYVQSNFGALDQVLRSFVRAQMGMEEQECRANPTIYAQMLREKKLFLRQQTRARQLRRVYMILLAKRPVPADIEGHNAMLAAYHEDILWKLMKCRDQKAKRKAEAAQREGQVRAQRKALARQGPGTSITAAQDAAAVRAFEDASSEIDVVQDEIQKYMVRTALEMLRKETNALTKTFEMSNLSMQAFIHPVQQYASTFDQAIDNRNHLDLINKVPAI